jgi:hypothetical protein
MNALSFARIKNFRTRQESSEIALIPWIPHQDPWDQHPTPASAGSSSSSISYRSMTTIREDLKTLPARRALANDENNIIQVIIGGAIESHQSLNNASMRIPSHLRSLPAFDGKNLASFLKMEFLMNKGPKGDGWNIKDMEHKGYFDNVNHLNHAVENLAEAASHSFKAHQDSEPNPLFHKALEQWIKVFKNQSEAFSVRKFPIDFMVEKVMETICKIPQALTSPALASIRDPNAIVDFVVEYVIFDITELIRVGDRRRLEEKSKSVQSDNPDEVAEAELAVASLEEASGVDHLEEEEAVAQTIDQWDSIAFRRNRD